MRSDVRLVCLVLVFASVSFLADGSVQSATASARETGQAGTGGCAWGFVMDPANNVIWPETNAMFWATPYILFPGSELVVTGSFPEGRYMSIKTYGFGTVIDSLNDQQISPDEGSENPFVVKGVPEEPEARRYTVRVRPGLSVPQSEDEVDNDLAAIAHSGTIGVGFLSYRVYVPDDPSDWTGGMGLPEVTLRLFNGLVERRLPTCGRALSGSVHDVKAGSAVAGGMMPPRPRATQAPEEGAVTPIEFRLNDAAHVFPNPDDAYLVGVAPYGSGKVAVIRAKAPTYPDTRAGAHVTDPHDLRYWSLCVHMLTWPLPSADCAGDFETVLDSDGYYTYVVSLPPAPANADAEQGITWVPWGRPGVDNALTLRNMLPDGGFAHAIQDVRPGAEAEVMAEYFPLGGVCDRELFETGGPDACLPSRG